MNWNDLRYVLAVARSKAIAPAARRLGVNETTVARRVAKAEQSLGSRLFERINGAMTPTEAGQQVIERAERVELEFDRLNDLAAGANGAISGTVRVSAIPLLVNRMLVPGLSRLYAVHPQLHVEAIAEPRNLSLLRRDTDIALRLARPDGEQSVMARRIGQISYAVYGPSRITGSDSLPWITYDALLGRLPHVVWINHAIDRARTRRPVLTVNDSEVALHAIKAGVGKSLLPCVAGDSEEGLTPLSKPLLDRELWLLVHPELKDLARVKVVAEWLTGLVRNGCVRSKRRAK